MILYLIEYSTTFQTEKAAICISKTPFCYLMSGYTIYNIYLINYNIEGKHLPTTDGITAFIKNLK